eukprot:SAG22_NODE_1_length_62449_cov_158.689270_60_plen_106_part_00
MLRTGLCLLAAAAAAAAAGRGATASPSAVPGDTTIANAPVMIDMVQNNPGDPVGWEQTKYFDPAELKKLDYTGMTTTGEMSGTQAVDFHTLGHEFFPAGSAERLW